MKRKLRYGMVVVLKNVRIGALLLASAACCHKNATAAVAMPDELKNGLVMYFDFNAEPVSGTVSDKSGNGNNGAATGVKWVANGRNGGGSAEFGLSHCYITVPNNNSLNPPNFTLAAWIKTDFTDSVWRRIFDKGWNKEYALSMCGDFPAGNSWRRGQFSLEIGAGGDAISGVRVADGKWHQVVGTFDGTEIKLYGDGRPVGRAGRGQGKAFSPAFDLTIGANRSNPAANLGEVDASFNGQMDDVMIYNRALPPNEVQTLFVAQGGVVASQVSPSAETRLPSELKYGLYIHYGMPTFAVWHPGFTGEMPASFFAPTNVNVKSWAHTAKEAGMSYAILTVKHESGFCLWDSQDYDYDVGSSPFKGDVIGDFIAACQAEEGILPGAHYSIPDAHNESAPRFNGPVPNLYFSLIKKHITELHTKYPGLRVQIFDASQRLSPAQWDELCQIVHKLNPKCVIMDHLHEGTVHDISASVNKGWMWRLNQEIVPAGQLFQRYDEAQKSGQSFLLNVGPGPLGNFQGNHVAVLTELKRLIAQGPSAVPTSPAPNTGKAPAAERLKQVKQLYDQGLISKEDYDKKVKEIMDSL